MDNLELAATILEKFQINTHVEQSEISDLRTHKAQRYALTTILSFTYNDQRFYISDDYSLNDNPIYLKNLLQDINPLVSGAAVENPEPQSDGARYAIGLSGTEYYLWQEKRIK